MISSPRVELYTAPFCVNCDRARELLERAGIAFEEIDLSAAANPLTDVSEVEAPELAGPGRGLLLRLRSR